MTPARDVEIHAVIDDGTHIAARDGELGQRRLRINSRERPCGRDDGAARCLDERRQLGEQLEFHFKRAVRRLADLALQLGKLDRGVAQINWPASGGG